MLPESQRELIRRRCEYVLRQNWREGIRTGDRLAFAYTCPSPGRYPWQWYWDSCCHAIAWRRFDRDRVSASSSPAGGARPDGFIGHTIFWERAAAGQPSLHLQRPRTRDPMTASIQPPMLAWAWRIAVGDPAAEPRIARQHEWLQEHRNLDDDGLLWIVAPTSPARTPPTSSTRSGATRPTACPGTWDSSTATAGWASTCAGSPPPGARCAARSSPTCSTTSRAWRWGARR